VEAPTARTAPEQLAPECVGPPAAAVSACRDV